MRLSQRVRRRVRRVIARAGAAEVAADQPVRIDDLVSPLRYDILVRQRYLSLSPITRAARGRPGSAARAIALPRVPHLVRGRRVPRFMPHLIGRDDEIAALFEMRVRATVKLVRSVQESGLDPKRPITLRTGRRIQPTASGKRLARRIYARDGCHRIALLRASGVTVLQPGTYRLDRQNSFVPLDNTSPLLRAAPIDTTTYWGFMALSYDSLVAADRSGPAPDGEANDPKRFAEMLAVAWIDKPLLHKGPDSASPRGL